MAMSNQADRVKPEVSFESEKGKADSEWDIYNALEVFSMRLGDLVVACWLLSIIWHTSLWPIGLFLLAFIILREMGVRLQIATRLVNTERFERDYEGRTPASMEGIVGLMERDWANLGRISKRQALSPDLIYLITHSPRPITIAKGQALAQDRAKARRQELLGIAWGIVVMVLTIMGILLSSSELLAAQSFVLVLIVASLLFTIARAKLVTLSSLWGVVQLVHLAIGGFALHLVLDSLNQQPLFLKLFAITTVAVVAYLILESATEALRRALVLGSGTKKVSSIIIALSYKYFPPFLFWILWTFIPQL